MKDEEIYENKVGKNFMGALTAVYSVTPDAMRKIQKNKKLMLKIFEEQADWRFESFDFDKGWETAIRIIGLCYPRTRNRLLPGKYQYHFGYEIWTVIPKTVKFVADDIASATFESLKNRGLTAPVTDYYGEPVPEELYLYYVGSIDLLKEFLRKAATDGNYLLFITA